MTDRQQAIRIINGALDIADDDMLKSMLCATHGHPPVVESCIGQITCARCNAILGDTLAGVYNLSGKALLNHENCENCAVIVNGLSEVERLFTKLPALKEYAAAIEGKA